MSNTLLKLIKFGIGFVLFIPLYVGGSFYFPFIFPKIWLFQLVIEIIFFFYILLVLTDSRFRPTRNIVFWALGALTAILILTSLTGIDAFRSFWGNTERMSGVIAWLHFAAFAIILAGVLKTGKEWNKFFRIAVLISIIQFFYVLAQYFQLPWVWLPNSQVGTIGNADLLGLYTNFNIFFAFYLWQGNRDIEISKYRVFWAAAFFINILTLYFDGSRGAILGFGAGLFVYMLVNICQRRESRKVWLGIVITVAVLYGILWMARDTDFVKNNYQLGRVTHISLQDTTVRQRFVEWGIAWNAFKSKPIFGCGPNNYLYLHNAFLNPRVYNLQETNFDRAHNAYLDYASMSGVIGLAGYLFLIGVLFWVFWKNKLWTWASLITAYAVNSFFVFDNPASYIAWFLTIGFAAFAYNTQHEIRNNQQSNQVPSSKFQASGFNPQVAAVFYVISFVFTLYLIWQVSWKPASANLAFVNGVMGLNGDLILPEESFESYKKALKYETLGTSEFRNHYVQWIQNNINKFPLEKRLEIIDFGIKELEREVVDHPIVFGYLNLGYLNYFMANGLSDLTLKEGFYKKAAENYDKATELAPGRLEVYYSYLQLSIATKNYQKGIEMMSRATQAAPNFPQTWWYLGIAYTSAGDSENAIKAINKAIAIHYGGNVKDEGGYLIYDLDKVSATPSQIAPKMEVLGVVGNYINTQRWKELLLLYLSAAKEDPSDVSIHQSLALVYQNLGRVDKVQEELQIIEELKNK